MNGRSLTTSLSLVLAATLLAPSTAKADEPPIRWIESVEREPIQDGGKPRIVIRGKGLAGVGAVRIGGKDVTDFLPTGDAVYVNVDALEPGDHRVELQWARLVSEPRTLCASRPLHVERHWCVLNPVPFQIESFTLNQDAEQVVQANAECMKKSQHSNLSLLGFESSEGKYPDLGLTRAYSVKERLAKLLTTATSDRIVAMQKRKSFPVLSRKRTSAGGNENATSRRVIFANTGAMACELEPIFVDPDKPAFMSERVYAQIDCFQRHNVTAVLIVVAAGAPIGFSDGIENQIDLTVRMQKAKHPMSFQWVKGTYTEVQQLAAELQRRPPVAHPKSRSNVAYFFPLQWLPEISTSTEPADDCTNITIVEPKPIKLPCEPCERAKPGSPSLPAPRAHVPRAFFSLRVTGLGGFGRKFAGAGVRVGGLFGSESFLFSLGIDAQLHGLAEPYTFPSGGSPEALLVPAFAAGVLVRRSSVEVGATLLSGPFIPTLDSGILDVEFALGFRLTQSLRLLGLVTPGAALKTEEPFRFQAGVGAAIDFY